MTISADFVLFLILAGVSVMAAAGMLLSTNPVHSALFLIVNFGTVSVLYLVLSAPFIAMVQVTVYAGAIMVLFLFVIMLLGIERLRHSSALRWQTPVAVGLGLLLLIEAAYVLFVRSGPGAGLAPGPLAASAETFGSPQNVGEVLFNQYLLPFEVTSVLLLVAMVGAIVLSRDEKR